MGICHDKATVMLRTQNYNVVRHPRDGIRPLQLIGKFKDAVHLLGGLDKLITNPPADLPKITPDQAAANLEGQQSDKQEVGIGLSFLGSILKALSGGNLDLKAQYQRARRLQFTFNDVVIDTLEPLDVGNYLKKGQVDADNLVLQQFILGKGTLFLITQTLKAKRITVKSENEKGAEVKVDVPAIKGLVSGNVGVSASADQASEVTYTGDKSIVFGFQAFRLGVTNGVLSLVPAPPGSISFGTSFDPSASSSPGDPVLIDDEETLIDFSKDDWEAEARKSIEA
jgi:hypothetical protein